MPLPACPLESLLQEKGYAEQLLLKEEWCFLLKLQRDFRPLIPIKAAANYTLGHSVGFAA